VLTRVIPNDPRLLFADAQEFELLHGETTGGLQVTLLSAFERDHSQIYANAVILGFHAESAVPPITAAAAVIEQLDEWWHPRALTDDPALKHPDVSVQYRQPADVELHDDGVIRTTLRSAGLPSYRSREVSIREEIRVEMKASAPQPLSVFRARMHACQDLLSVAALTLCSVEELRLVPPYEDKRKAVIGRFYAVPIYKDPASRGADFLFRSRDVETRLPSMFGAWLESAERLSVVRSLYFSGAYGKTFLELRLLAFAQAAEAYHRRVYEGQDLYMDADVYERDVLPQLRSAIPKIVGSDHRQALKKRMEFGNEVSFGRRLRTLVKEHEAALGAAVPDPCSWVQTIVNYRNGFTHHPVADETMSDRDKIELIRCNYVLQILLELCFLKSMTLDAETIAALARKCDRYRKIRERFFSEDASKESGAKVRTLRAWVERRRANSPTRSAVKSATQGHAVKLRVFEGPIV
jgi:hypothetical protein